MHLLMHANSLNVRGATGAMVKYAEQLSILGHTVTIAFSLVDEDNDKNVIDILRSKFTLIGYETFEKFAKEYDSKFDFAYFIN